MSEWIHLGTHKLTVDGDLAFIRLCGTVSLPDALELVAIMAKVRAEHGRLYLLFDGTQVAGVDAAARRMFAEWNRDHAISAVANFGGGAMQRALAFLLSNAIRLLIKRTPPFTYVDTESQARAWIDEQRTKQQG